MKKILFGLAFVLVLVSCVTTPNGDLLNSRIGVMEREILAEMDKVDPATVPQQMRYDIDRNIVLYRVIHEAKQCGYKPGPELDRFLLNSPAYAHLNEAIDAKAQEINTKAKEINDQRPKIN